jgi:hypothetical protein
VQDSGRSTCNYGSPVNTTVLLSVQLLLLSSMHATDCTPAPTRKCGNGHEAYRESVRAGAQCSSETAEVTSEAWCLLKIKWLVEDVKVLRLQEALKVDRA